LFRINNHVSGLSSIDVDFRGLDLYKEFTAEREEILRNKWYMSEKAGKDVGFERALIDWVSKHRNNWKKNRKKL
jgi:hypothetical protein